MNELLVEKIETLDGSRGGRRARETLRRAAVRLEDIAAVLDMRAEPRSSKAAGSTVTQAEFDALVDDVHHLHRMLRQIHDAVQARLL